MFLAEAKASQDLVTLSLPGSLDHKAMVRSVLLLEKHGGRSSAGLQTMAWLLMVDPHHVEEFSTVSVLTLTTPLTCSTIVARIIPGVTH